MDSVHPDRHCADCLFACLLPFEQMVLHGDSEPTPEESLEAYKDLTMPPCLGIG